MRISVHAMVCFVIFAFEYGAQSLAGLDWSAQSRCECIFGGTWTAVSFIIVGFSTSCVSERKHLIVTFSSCSRIWMGKYQISRINTALDAI
jgi:hypothetical protein